MNVDYISDLHIDFYVRYSNTPTKRKRLTKEYVQSILPEAPSDTLIIAGDISHYNTQAVEVITELTKVYSNILVTYGNHDMYMTSESQRIRYEASYLRVADLKGSCEEIDGVWFLDGDKIEIDGVTYGGLCGWYSLPTKQDTDYWRYFMNDSNYIYSGVEYRTPYHHGGVRAEWSTQDFYNDEVEKLKSLKDIDVLITHVAQCIPPDEVIVPMFRGDASNIFYYVDNMDLVKATGCKYYIYGHTHGNQEWQQQGIKVRVNPKGYPGENPTAKIKTIEVKDVINEKTII